MADDLKTLREAALAIDGLRSELVAQINGLTHWTQGLAALGLVVGGFYGYQLYSLNYSVGSLANAVETTQKEMTALRTETGENLGAIRKELESIREALNVRPVPPEKGGFPEKQGNLAPIQSNGDKDPAQQPMPGKYETPAAEQLKGP